MRITVLLTKSQKPKLSQSLLPFIFSIAGELFAASFQCTYSDTKILIFTTFESYHRYKYLSLEVPIFGKQNDKFVEHLTKLRMNGYFIDYHPDISVDEFEVLIRSLDGLPLSEIKIKDLVFYCGKPIYSGNGVYIFKCGDEICYVGNCVARSFVERIPAHFDIRAVGWFHSLLTAIIKNKYGKMKKTDKLLQEAAVIAFEDLSLILINFSNEYYNKISINNLENMLGNTLKPYNSRFRKLINPDIPTL